MPSASTVDVAVGQTLGTFSGTVTDGQGGALPGAIVVALHLSTGAIVEGATGPDGRYALTGLRPGGPFKITVHMSGFASQERRDLFATAGERRGSTSSWRWRASAKRYR